MTSIPTSNHKAFTLIELLMVVGVIGILSAIGVTAYINFAQDARRSVTTDKLKVIQLAIIGDARFYAAGKHTSAGYNEDCLGAPSVIADLVTMPGAGTCSTVYDPYTKRGWRGPYVNATADPNWNKDAWGIAFEFLLVGPPARTIRSGGPDVTLGTGDDISVKF